MPDGGTADPSTAGPAVAHLTLFGENEHFRMKSSPVAVLVTILLALAVPVSDYFLKVASSSKTPFLNWNFVLGLLITFFCTFGWVLVMPHLKLAYIGVIYSLTVVLSLCLVGAVFFDEQLKPAEWVGVGLAIASMVLLYQRMA
jgi:small multidrug resistance pump